MRRTFTPPSRFFVVDEAATGRARRSYPPPVRASTSETSAVAVGDESLHPVPAAMCRCCSVPRAPSASPLRRIRTRVRLREVHRTGRTGLETHGAENFGIQLLRGELVERLGAVLQAPRCSRSRHPRAPPSRRAIAKQRRSGSSGRRTCAAATDRSARPLTTASRFALRALGVHHPVVHHLRPLRDPRSRRWGRSRRRTPRPTIASTRR